MKLPQPGEILEEKYKLDRVLGQGAFGIVFHGTTISTNRPVAVKVLKPAPDSRSGSRSARFLRELRTIANLQCPNTLTLYDYGRTADGVLFMVTEYIEGEDLYDLVARRGPLEEHEVVHVLHQILLSLAEAHELNVLHRDIKPHNIRLYQYQGDPLQVKVLDFGLSKSLEDEPEAALTGAGLIVGTPRYMSPEQLRGKPLTPASDIYSLGLVAYEMLLGRPAVPLDAMVGQTRQIQIDPEDRITRPMREVVNTMLKRPIAERYKTAGEVLAALRPLRGRGPVSMDEESDTVADDSTAAELLGREVKRPVRPRPVIESTGRTVQMAPLAFLVAALVGLGFAAFVIAPKILEKDPAPQPARRVYAAPAPIEAPPEPVVEDEPLEVPVEPTGDFDACVGMRPYNAGTHVLSQISGLTQISVTVRVPPGYEPAKPHPVIWLFPDRHQTTVELLGHIDFEAADELDKFIVVASSVGKFSEFATSSARNRVQNDLAVVAESLCLDPDRMFVIGHGRGGEAAEAMLCDELRISGIATTSYRVHPHRVAGRCVPAKPVPYLNISPLSDPFEPADGSVGCLLWPPPSVAQHVEIVRAPYECTGSPRRARGLPKECETWDCTVPFVSCEVPGGRTWPGSSIKGPVIGDCKNPPNTFPFTRTIWQFFDSIEAPK